MTPTAAPPELRQNDSFRVHPRNFTATQMELTIC